MTDRSFFAPKDDATESSITICDVCDAEEDSAEADEEWILLSAGNSRTLFVYICPECAQSKKSLQDGFNIFVDALPEAMQTERG